MNPQPSQTSPNSQSQLIHITSTLLDILGLKNSQEHQKIQSATIFILNLFRKYAGQINRKLNQVKLSRLNGFLYKVCQDIPNNKQDISIIIQLILLFLNNQSSTPIDDDSIFISNVDSFAYNTCIWIAKFAQDVLAVHFPLLCIQLVDTILTNKKQKLMSVEQFQKIIVNSAYFKDREIIKVDEEHANQQYMYKGFMSQSYISDELKQAFNLFNLFSNLYDSHNNKSQIIQLYIQFCREIYVENSKQIFVKVFVLNRVQTKDTLSTILFCLESQFFTADDFQQIVTLLLKTNDRKIFYSFSFKGFRYQNKYLEILTQQIKPNVVEELAQIFLTEKQTNNYYLLYLINKSNQKLSEKFLSLPINKIITNRHAIIIVLCINHNFQTAHSKILRHFFEDQNNLSNANKINYLKLAHFSYLNVPKSYLFTQIIKSIPQASLDLQANFDFLPKQNYQKIQLDKNEREQLNDFLSRYFGNIDDVYWIKLDLYSLCGKQLECMQDFKKIQKLFQLPLENIISQLPVLSQNLLEIVLMGVNNKFYDHLIINPTNVGAIVQWGLDLYKKEQKKFKTATQLFLKKKNRLQFIDLCIELFQFNLDQKTQQPKAQLQFDEELKFITSTNISRKLNGLNFSEYFMCQQEQSQLNLLMRSKTVIIELQKIIKLLTPQGKTQNRKQLKSMISQQSTPLRALKIINFLSSSIPYQKHKNPEKFLNLTDKLLSFIRPDFEYLKQLQTRSTQVNIAYAPIYQSLEFLLSVNYQKTLIFISNLLKSNKNKTQQKIEKSSKKNKKKVADQAGQKNIQNIAQNLQFYFSGDPNTLANYQAITTIITEIDNTSYSDKLAKQVAKWVTKIKMFHKQQYQDWKNKVTNYIKLWETISSIVSPVISIKQIQRHFLIMIDLLNTLYQKHKNEKDLLIQEKKLLGGLYVFYHLSYTIDKNQMQQQIEQVIPQQKLNQVIINNQLPELGIPHVYYCYDCSKKVCHECITIFHKNHDKNYIGSGNQTQCHRGQRSKQSVEKKNSKLRFPEKAGLQAFERQRQRERARQLQLQKLYMNINQSISPQLYMRLKQEKHFILKKSERGGPHNLIVQSQNIDVEFDEQKKKQQNNEQVQKFQIKSCSEKQFSVKNSTTISNITKPKPVFQNKQNKRKHRNCKLNLTPLFNLLIRQLRSNTFFYMLQQNDQKNIPQFEAEISNQKYTMFKNDCFRNNIAGLRNTYLMNQQTKANGFSIIKRGLIAMNDKFIAILSGGFSTQLHCLDSGSIKTKFIKRQTQKRYKENDALENYQYNQNKINEPSILEIVFSPFAHHLIAEISSHRILFEKISRQSRGRLITSQQANNEIQKFQWIKANGLRSFFSYLAGSCIYIGKIDERESNAKLKITLGDRKIKDYCNIALNSKVILMTILDTQGKLYRTKVDIPSKKIPTFNDYQIILNQTDQICSVICNGPSLYCTTVNGKLIVINLNQDNNLISSPITFPIVEMLRNHKVSEINNKFKQVTKIIKLRYITKHQNQIYFSCLLIKQNPAQIKRIGYFVLLTLNIQNKRSKIIMYNDQGLTDSYDFMMLSQKQFMFICLQEDGEVWCCKFNAQAKSNLGKFGQNNLIVSLSLNEITKYAEQISKSNLLNQIQYYQKERKPSFKQNPKITDRYKIHIMQDVISFQVLQKFTRVEFTTGIQFGYTHHPQTNAPVEHLAFSFLGNVYRYNITKTREIQISLTIKQVLSLYLGIEQFKIKFLQGKPNQVVNVKDINIFGVKNVDKSVYFQSLNSLCELIYIYKSPKQLNGDKKLQKYFYNQLDIETNTIQPRALQQYFIKKKFSLSQQNILMKLQMLRESTRNQKFIQYPLLFQCFESIRNHILPNCHQRKQLLISVQKLCRNLTQSSTSANVKLGYILNYQTQLDIYNIFRMYKIFLTQFTIDSYQDLLNTFCTIINTRTLDAFIVMSIYPQIIKQMTRFFKKLLVDYRLYFKVNDFGLEKDQKFRLNKICRSLIRIIIENYQLNKNRNTENKQNCENQFLITLENIFCLTKSLVHREIKINPFQYIQSTFEDGLYIHTNPPLNYLKLQAVDIEEQRKPVQQNSLNASEEIKPNQPIQNQLSQLIPAQNSQYVDEIEQSCEQYKQQQQQNRQMMDDFAYDMIAQGVQKNGQEQQDIESDKNQLKGQQLWKGHQINPKKIFDYLSTCCSGMTPQKIQFVYYEICENLLLEIYGCSFNNRQHKYLNSDNLVFYVGLVYNLFLIIQKKIANIFANSPTIDFGHPYIQNTIMPIIQTIDSKIDCSSHSILYLPLNNIIASNPKNYTPHLPQPMLIQCLIHFYTKNLQKSKLFTCLRTSNWHPDQFKPAASLYSVFRFEYFEQVNPLYQIKYIGNVYLYLLRQKLQLLEINENIIKQNILKIVVKYNLRVYRNIMVIKAWSKDLQKSKINVAFERLNKKPEQSLKVIIKSINKDIKSFVEDTYRDGSRISCLESMLGVNGGLNQLILDILNYYYSYQHKN